ncbi:MAG: ACP S-malonyltransferase [Propionibacteriaceae bacterium]|nr:ACP S-malonyltransferase [Propionibacteriaceae bacterium]
MNAHVNLQNRDALGTLRLFPGQGSQAVGMGRVSVQTSHAAAEFFDAASEALAIDLRKLCWQTSLDVLTRTENAQVALTACCIADWLAFTHDNDAEPNCAADACAGHSNGAVAAAVAAGFLTPVEGMRLAAARGALMAQAPKGGSMLAVIPPSVTVTEQELAGVAQALADEYDVDVGALNSPHQFVLSGDVGRLLRIHDRLDVNSKMLTVSNAFHSRFMRPVVPRWIETVESCDFHDGWCKYVGCTTATATSNADDVKFDLVEGMTRPVRWLGVMEATKTLPRIEVFGPGQVIVRLARSHLGLRKLQLIGGGH